MRCVDAGMVTPGMPSLSLLGTLCRPVLDQLSSLLKLSWISRKLRAAAQALEFEVQALSTVTLQLREGDPLLEELLEPLKKELDLCLLTFKQYSLSKPWLMLKTNPKMVSLTHRLKTHQLRLEQLKQSCSVYFVGDLYEAPTNQEAGRQLTSSPLYQTCCPNHLPKHVAPKLFGRDVPSHVKILIQHRMLQLMGGPGEGKSELAAAVANHMWLAGHCLAGAYWIDMTGVGEHSTAVQDWICQQLICQTQLPDIKDWASVLGWANSKSAPALLVLDNVEEAAGSRVAAEDLAFVLNSLHDCSMVYTIVCSQAPLPCVKGLPASASLELTPLTTAAALQLLLHCISDPSIASRTQLSFKSESEWELPAGPVLAQSDCRAWQMRSSPVNGSADYSRDFTDVTRPLFADYARTDRDSGRDSASPSSSPAGKLNSITNVVVNDANAVRDQTSKGARLEEESSPFASPYWRQAYGHSRSLPGVVASSVAKSSISAAGSRSNPPASRESTTPDSQSRSPLLQGEQVSPGSQRGVAVRRASSLHHGSASNAAGLVKGSEISEDQGGKHWFGWHGSHRRGTETERMQWNSREEEDHAKALIHKVHANPLMLTVAAALLRQRVVQWQDLLSNGRPDSYDADSTACSSHSSLLYCWLLRCLSDHELGFLSQLTIFPGSFSSYGAMHVQPPHPAPLSIPSPSHTLHCILSLSLVRSFTSACGERFMLPTLVRWAARECVREEQWLYAETRFLDWMVREESGPGWLLSHHHPARGTHPDPQLCLQVLEHECVNLQEVCKTLPVVADAVTQRLPVVEEEGSSTSREKLVSVRSLTERDQQEGDRQKLHSILGQVHQLCTCLRELSQFQLESRLEQAIWDTAATKLGPRHTDTLGAKNQLANTLCCMGRLVRSKQLHQEVLTARTSILGERHRDTAHTKARLGMVLQRMGELDEAQKLQREALNTLQDVLGKGHYETLDVLGELAKTLRLLGDLKAARLLFQQELDARMSAHGVRHPHTLGAMERFAAALEEMGELQQARHLMEEVLRVREETLGFKHPGTQRTKMQLANMLCVLGELQRAVQLFQDAAAGLEWILGPRHPDTLLSQSKLASTLWELGEWRQAFQRQEQLVQQYKAVHGPREQYSLASQHKLADMHMQLGEYSRAVHLLEQLCEVCGEDLGESSLEAMRARLSLGEAYRRLGELQKSWHMLQQLLESCMLVHGLHHEETWRVKRTLAVVTAQLGELEKGRELLEDALNFQVRHLGQAHPESIRTRHCLAKTLRHLGNVRHARRLQEEVLKAFVMVLGPQHPDTLSAQHSLAKSLQQLGEIQEAHQLLQDLWEAYMSVLGAHHPSLLSLKHSFAISFRQQGQVHMARELLEQLLQEQLQALGPLHPNTLTVKHTMAGLLQDMGELQAAYVLEQEVLYRRQGLFGEQHPDVLASRCMVGFLEVQMGKLQPAQVGLKETWEACALVLGPWHPDTLTAKYAVGEALCMLGDLQHAQRLQQEVLEARLAELGSRHPDTLVSKQALAATMHELGQLEAARQLQEEVVTGRMAVLGPQHLDTLQAKLDLADMLEDGGEVQTAKALRDDVQGVVGESMGGRKGPAADEFGWGCGVPCSRPMSGIGGTLTGTQPGRSATGKGTASSRSNTKSKSLKNHIWGCWVPMADACVYKPDSKAGDIVLTHSVEGTTGKKLHGKPSTVSAESAMLSQYTVIGGPRPADAKTETLHDRVTHTRARAAVPSTGAAGEEREEVGREVVHQRKGPSQSDSSFWAEGTGRWSPEEAAHRLDPEQERRRELEAVEAWDAL